MKKRMILSLSSVRTHTAQGDFFPGRMPLSTPMIPFRAHVLSGSGNRKAGGGGDEIGAARAADMDSRTENFFALGAAGMAAGLPCLEGHDGEDSGLPAPGWSQQRESMMRWKKL
jgi:hypothetical protein